MPNFIKTAQIFDLHKRVNRKVAAVAVVLILSLSGGGYVAYRSAHNVFEIPKAYRAATRYPDHRAIATIFWIGERATQENGYITNEETAWDSNPASLFGGVDDPDHRTPDGSAPAGFTPAFNPYYFALPATEFDKKGPLDAARKLSPWSNEAVDDTASLFKGRWVEIIRGDKKAYAQWFDVGPFEDYDYRYVFGTAPPKNSVGERAGIDLSPATAAALGIDGAATTTWRFVDAKNVPDGAWTRFPAISAKTHWK